MSNEDTKILESLRKERSEILSQSVLPPEAVGRVEKIDLKIEDIERNYDSMRMHELDTDTESINVDIDYKMDSLEDNYDDYDYGEVSESFKDPNLDY